MNGEVGKNKSSRKVVVVIVVKKCLLCVGEKRVGSEKRKEKKSDQAARGGKSGTLKLLMPRAPVTRSGQSGPVLPPPSGLVHFGTSMARALTRSATPSVTHTCCAV